MVWGKMKGIIITFLFASLITVSLSEEHVREYESITYLLRLQWLPGQCKAFGNTCIESKVVDDNWTIHGLWTYENCHTDAGLSDGEHPFSDNVLNEIISELKMYWVDIREDWEDGDDPYKFWRDEFQKHGCVTNWQELNYFKKALSVYKQYNPESKLTQAGITPGASYSRERFQNVFETSVQLKCNSDNSINEIQFCLDEEFNAVDCGRGKDCSDEDILYLKKDESNLMRMKQRVSW